MNGIDGMVEVVLQPGGFHFGDRYYRIRTLLGSCVAVTLWHPARLLGGMCHFMLPSRRPRPASAPFDGRYADEAFELFLDELGGQGTRPFEYEVKMFGGGHQISGLASAGDLDIAERNLEAARHLLRLHGFELEAEDVGGWGPRSVILDAWSGDVWLRHREMSDRATA